MHKYRIMAQFESQMTLSKALALWKNNTGVVDIDGALENQYRNLTLV